MTSTDAAPLEAMLAHHSALADGVARRVAALRLAVECHDRFETSAAELIAYLAKEVLPHALAEEQTLYQVAAHREDLTETVAGMADEHQKLAALAERLARARDATAASAAADAIGALFEGHVLKENELILPPLAADPRVDLAGLLVEMRRLTLDAPEEVPVAEKPAIVDGEAALVRILLHAANQLADAGRGDVGCRLAAEAWAAVRSQRPDLAVWVTAALHRLVRVATAEPVTLSTGRPESVAADAVLDVRAVPPAQRHEKIFATYGALGPGTGFLLVNDHDPKPLRYQFEAEHRGEFSWDTLEAGPTVWRVRIARPPAVSDEAGEESRAGTPSESELDVRPFTHARRHDVIFATFGALAEGAGFILVNDHDPRPLRFQFDAQHAGRYSWDYLEAGPEVWRVRIGRPAGTEA